MNDMVYRLPAIFPRSGPTNWGFAVMAPRNEALPSCLAIDGLPDLAFFTYAAQFFSRWRFEPADEEGTFALNGADVIDGYRRIDNITDEALRRFRAAYGVAISKDDVFY